jgi:hypothetical protein
MTRIYKNHGYEANIHPCGTCVVTRSVIGHRDTVMTTHCGEKHTSQDWREVRILGCPDEIRVEIVKAWRRFTE